MKTATVLLLAGLLAGCAQPVKRETVFVPQVVDREVHVCPVVPGELMQSPRLEKPHFISPTDPAAVTALDRENQRRLREALVTLKRRDEMWREYARLRPSRGTAPRAP